MFERILAADEELVLTADELDDNAGLKF